MPLQPKEAPYPSNIYNRILYDFCVLFPLFWFFGFFFYWLWVLGPVAQQELIKLQNEFALIPSLTQTTLQEYRISAEPQKASVSASYLTALDQTSIFNFYDVELSNLGWHFLSQETNYGTTIRIYCKDNHTLYFYHYSPPYQHDSDYIIWMRAQFPSECFETRLSQPLLIFSFSEALWVTIMFMPWGFFSILGMARNGNWGTLSVISRKLEIFPAGGFGLVVVFLFSLAVTFLGSYHIVVYLLNWDKIVFP